MQKIKTQKGITLIALIITIIVMLILVAVTLVITLGDNGIIAKAREAKNTQALRQEAEKLELGANAGNNIDVQNLAGGIYTAMVTTLAGLVVGIIGYFAYNYLTSLVDKVVRDMEAHSLEFMDILNDPEA